MDGGCRASSLGVLINKLSQSCRAPSNSLSLSPSLSPPVNPPPVTALGSLSNFRHSGSQINLLPQYVHQLIVCNYSKRFAQFKPLVFSFCLAPICMHWCARTFTRRPHTARILSGLTSSLKNCCFLCTSCDRDDLLEWRKSFNLLHKCWILHHLTCKTCSECPLNILYKLPCSICSLQKGQWWNVVHEKCAFYSTASIWQLLVRYKTQDRFMQYKSNQPKSTQQYIK